MPKKKDVIANPLFVQWLQEMIDELNQKSSANINRPNNAVFTYRKALSSLRKYPIPLRSGLDAVKVSGIGNQIAQKLEDRLQKYLEDNSTTIDKLLEKSGFPNLPILNQPMTTTKSLISMTEELHSSVKENRNLNNTKSISVANSSAAASNNKETVSSRCFNESSALVLTSKLDIESKYALCLRNSNDLSLFSQEDNHRKRHVTTQDSNHSDKSIKQKQPRTRKEPKQYIPKYRSGAYAILVSMYENRHLGYLTRQQIIQLAQPHCDVSMDIPESSRNGGFGYTGWSSMKSLVEKEFVFKYGNPARYSLYDEGVELARKLAKTGGSLFQKSNSIAEEHGQNSENGSTFLGDVQFSQQSTTFFSSQESVTTTVDNGCSNESYLSGSSEASNAKVCFLSNTGEPCHLKKRAEVKLVDGRPLVKIIYRTDSVSFDFVDKVYMIQNTDDSYTVAWAEDRHLPELFIKDISTFGPFPATFQNDEVVLRSTSLLNDTTSRLHHRDQNHLTSESASTINLRLHHDTDFDTSRGRVLTSNSQISLNRTSGLPVINKHYPGSYKITLILDNREVRSKQDRSYFQANLLKFGVNVETYPLSVGDAIWVATPTSSSSSLNESGQLISKDHVVLGYVLERKTLDDLIYSIRDGRWKEQKFRLNQCAAASHVIYLIEKSTAFNVQNFGHDAIMTALVNTQLQHGFFVKETANAQETIEYFVNMTGYLEKKFKNKTLHVIPSNCLSRNNMADVIKQYQTYYGHQDFYIQFSDYQELSTKSKTLTVRDVTTKMLLCVRGVSAEKASQIVKHYPTIRSLRKAYLSCSSKEEGEHLLKHLDGAGRKAIPTGLSKKIYSLLCDDQY